MAAITLDRPRIFILPTRYGALFGALLLVMLIGSINYSNSLGLTLTFLLAGLAQVSILHTYRNLAGLTLSAGKAEPVFAGEEAKFTVVINNPTTLARYAIRLRVGKGAPVLTDVAPRATASVQLSLPAPRRGRLRMGQFRVATRFPLGLFGAWSNLDLGMCCLVYPHPGAHGALPATATTDAEHGEQGRGTDDFAGLRGYSPGDSLRHVHWKAAARSQGLLTKQFGGQQPAELWLDWDKLPGMESEARLSQLCRWVLDAQGSTLRFGLRLPGRGGAPGMEIAPTTGEAHKHACLAALALF